MLLQLADEQVLMGHGVLGEVLFEYLPNVHYLFIIMVGRRMEREGVFKGAK